MAGARKTERERLTWAIDLLYDWEERHQWAEVENVFLHLDALDRSQNADLWIQLRQALSSNEALHEPELQRFLRNEKWAAGGRWWYDPEQWTPIRA